MAFLSCIPSSGDGIRSPAVATRTVVATASSEAVAIASMVILASPASAAQNPGESFDHLPAQEILPGNPLILDHFRVELPLGGVAVVRPAEDNDDLASGMVPGAPDDWTLAHLALHFDQPWRRLTVSLVMPPTTDEKNGHSVACTGCVHGNSHAS
jgi:hypothetical protein